MVSSVFFFINSKRFVSISQFKSIFASWHQPRSFYFNFLFSLFFEAAHTNYHQQNNCKYYWTYYNKHYFFSFEKVLLLVAWLFLTVGIYNFFSAAWVCSRICATWRVWWMISSIRSFLVFSRNASADITSLRLVSCDYGTWVVLLFESCIKNFVYWCNTDLEVVLSVFICGCHVKVNIMVS